MMMIKAAIGPRLDVNRGSSVDDTRRAVAGVFSRAVFNVVGPRNLYDS
jgi:hypothetical protein